MVTRPNALSIVLAGGEGKRLMPLTADRAKPRVAVFFLADPKPVENWPWPGWNPEPRAKELADALARGCPDVEFEFFASHRNNVPAGVKAKDRFDGVLYDGCYFQPLTLEFDLAPADATYVEQVVH